MTVERDTWSLASSPDPVTVAIHRPSRRRRPAVLLTPGAGGDLDGAGLVALAELLTDLGCVTVRANLPHNEAGRRAPRADRSVAHVQALVEVAESLTRSNEPMVLAGKSYGGRVASMAVAAGTRAAGLLFYGYPLHPPGKPDKLRVEHWPDVDAPCLFLQGERDTFGTAEEVGEHLRKLPRRSILHPVAGGDHSLRVTGAASPDGRPSAPADTIAGLRGPVREWLALLT
ncbi:MAG: dienelactone hydrolase family protein [Nitriliruptoraceae bacterium]|nr:dienelactone hydrolase family protein [Nitriliruptoraceae bacterium]